MAKRRPFFWLVEPFVGLSFLPVTLTLYWQIAFTGQILASYDLFTYFYPQRAYAAEALRAGHLPLWNPYLFMGAPFLANIQTAVLYPFTWLGLFFDAPQAASVSILSHVFLAGVFSYAFGRVALGLGRPGAYLGGLVFALGGFFTQQVGHINQLNAMAWLPFIFLCFNLAFRRRLAWLGLGGLGVGLQLLAGHPQVVYITGAGLGLYALVEVLAAAVAKARTATSWWRGLGRGLAGLFLFGVWALVALAVMMGLGAALAGVQLLPTLELSAESIRSGGLSYLEAVSFSLPPPDIFRSLLPGFTENPFSEYVGYVGVLPLGLALLALLTRWRHRTVVFGLLASLTALFLALGGYNPFYKDLFPYLPGANLFRVPARWLLLNTFALSVLAGVGLDSIARHRPGRWPAWARFWARLTVMGGVAGGLAFAAWQLGPLIRLPQPTVLALWGLLAGTTVLLLTSAPHWAPRPWMAGVVLIGLAGAELFFAGRELEFSRPVPPEAWSSLRPTLAQILLDRGAFRVLSLASSEFEPGDQAELRAALQGALSPRITGEFLVSNKYKEMLAANLPLAYGIATVDGYDGGVLPLRRYADFKELLTRSANVGKGPHLPLPSAMNSDTLLRYELSALPDPELLGRLNVRYIIADKRSDLWMDGIYFDQVVAQRVSPNQKLKLPLSTSFATTTLGLISYVEGAADLRDGTPVARITIVDQQDRRIERELRLGVDISEGWYDHPWIRPDHSKAKVAATWSGPTKGYDYLAKVDLGQTIYPREIEIEYLLPSWQMYVRALSLVDDRAAVGGGAPASEPVMLDGRLRPVYSGDLKIYQNLAEWPRAFLVPQGVVASDWESALGLLSEGLGDKVVLETTPPAISAGPLARWQDVDITSYAPEEVRLVARLSNPGFLVLTDAYYPGWRAWVDGREQEVLRADYLFRALFLEAGEHEVVFRFLPDSLGRGMWASYSGAVVTALVLIAGLAQALRKRFFDKRGSPG